MLKTIYSERGMSEKVKEETTFMLFLDLLHEYEGNFIIIIIQKVFQTYISGNNNGDFFNFVVLLHTFLTLELSVVTIS